METPNRTLIASSQPVSPAYGYLILSCIPLVTVFGNGLVIIAVMRDKKLKISVTNRYTAALAFSDLIVGLVPMPLAVYVKVNRDYWDLGVGWCRLYVACDVASSTASILHLALISADRYLAVMWPHEYQRYAKQARVSFPVALVWMISFTICIPVVMGKSILSTPACWLENPEYMLYSSLLSFYIPAGVMTLMYVKIFRKLNRLKTIRSMLRATGAGGETAGPFNLPLVVVQEVSCPLPVPGDGLKARSDPQSTDTSASHCNQNCSPSTNQSNIAAQTRALSNAVTAAAEKLVTQSAASSREKHRVRGEQVGFRRDARLPSCNIDDEVEFMDCSPIGLPQRARNNDDPHARPRHRSKQTIEDRRKEFKRSISALPRRPRVLGARRLSLWLTDQDNKEYSFDASLLDSQSSLLGCGTSGPPVIDRYDSKVWAAEVIKEEQLLERTLSTRRRPSADLQPERTQLYTVPLASTGGALKKFANRLTAALLHRKTEKQAFVKERRATKMVAVILGVFIICWLPFFTFNTMRGICLSVANSSLECDWLPADLFFLTTWLGYANSGFNPIIYGLVNEQFRATYKRLLRWPAAAQQSSWSLSQISAV